MGRIWFYSGVIGPVIFFSLLTLAIQNYPDYNPYTNYLSDLGVPPESGWFFNSALALSGIFGFIFAYAIRDKLRKTGPMLLMTGSLFLTLVSIFTSKDQPMHTAFAGIFFLTTAAGFIVISNELRKKTKAWVMLAGSVILSLMFVLSQIAITEHAAVVAINLSLIVLAVYFLKQR